MTHSARFRAIIALLVVAAACDGSPAGPGGLGNGRYTFTVVGGDGQRGLAASRLPVPLGVRVTEGEQPVPGVAVTWAVTTGNGTVAQTTATGPDGVATALLELGTAGAHTIRAAIDGEAGGTVFSATAVSGGYPRLLAEVPIPPNYGIHDTFVRDGLAFVSAWNTGLIVYDVGDGRAGGSPSRPVEVSRIVTSDNGVPGGPAVHNAWWFHNPVTNEKRYVFVGQEGPSTLFATASGDLHVVDVSDLTQPREVASLRISGAGAHNVWMDEARQLLYAAFYNGGVVALDVSGTLAGDLTTRIVARREPGGAGNTFVWGVQLAGGHLWAADMVSGLWRLDPATLAVTGGGQNVPDRYTSDLWIHGDYGYTGSWGAAPRNGTGFGNAVLVWRLGGAGPALVDSIVLPDVRTVSDVEVSDDGALLVVTTERLAGQGLYVYDLADPARPALRGHALVATGLHTGTLARIGGRLFVFAARNPANPALEVYDITP